MEINHTFAFYYNFYNALYEAESPESSAHKKSILDGINIHSKSEEMKLDLGDNVEVSRTTDLH